MCHYGDHTTGKVIYCDKIGFQDLEKNIPVQNDTIFRMYSQTKLVTGVAAMTYTRKGNSYWMIPFLCICQSSRT